MATQYFTTFSIEHPTPHAPLGLKCLAPLSSLRTTHASKAIELYAECEVVDVYTVYLGTKHEQVVVTVYCEELDTYDSMNIKFIRPLAAILTEEL